MLNPCENCFSALKKRIKELMAAKEKEINNCSDKGKIAKIQKAILMDCYQEAYNENIITAASVYGYQQHCQKFVTMAELEQPMELGK